MLRYFFRRLAMMGLIILGVATFTFVLSRALPSSPVEMMLGSKPSAEQIERAKVELGLDRPVAEQLGRYFFQLAQGQFGTSLRTGQPVIEEIGRRLSATAELVSLSLLLAVTLGLPLGILSAARRNRWADHLTRVLAVSGVAVPVFFLGILLQMTFYGWLGWLPLQGRIDSNVMLDHPVHAATGLMLVDSLLGGNAAAFRSALAHLALPTMTLMLASLATILRSTRKLMIDVLGTDYMRTARAYGADRRTIYFVLALKPTLVPLLTVIGLTYGFMLGGSVITEVLFDWPGIGAYVVESVVTNDYPAVLGVTLVISTLYLSINLAVDMLYFVLDPRISA
ncbi:MAG: ABC transporter permease [Sterolibacterium sp.]